MKRKYRPARCCRSAEFSACKAALSGRSSVRISQAYRHRKPAATDFGQYALGQTIESPELPWKRFDKAPYVDYLLAAIPNSRASTGWDYWP
jgi:hypothetical protein